MEHAWNTDVWNTCGEHVWGTRIESTARDTHVQGRLGVVDAWAAVESVDGHSVHKVAAQALRIQANGGAACVAGSVCLTNNKGQKGGLQASTGALWSNI
eukprot:364955-Chlamydomonas_euryale.AAC.31